MRPGESLSLLGDYRITGRDSLVFLVDASKEMFIKGEDGQPSNFDMTMQVRFYVLHKKCVFVFRYAHHQSKHHVCCVIVGCAQCVHQ